MSARASASRARRIDRSSRWSIGNCAASQLTIPSTRTCDRTDAGSGPVLWSSASATWLRDHDGAALGPGLAQAVAILVPWVACIAGWIVAGVFTPSGTDNTPILTHDPLDIERELADHERRERATHEESPTEMAGSR